MDQPWQWLSDLLFGETPTDTVPDHNQRSTQINMPYGSPPDHRCGPRHQADTDGS